MRAWGIGSLDDLQRQSVADPAWFWDAVVRDLGLAFLRPYERVLDLGRGKHWPRWFVGGRYNYVHNALDRHAAGPLAGKTALVWEGEEGTVRRLTYSELAESVDRAATGLQNAGIGRGDRVGLFMPMVPEVVVTMLACGKLGAPVIPIFSGYSAPAAAVRLGDCGARAVIASDAFPRRGRVVPLGATAIEAAKAVPSVEVVVLARRLGVPVPTHAGVVLWDGLCRKAGGVTTVETDPDEPCMLIYTSGTTGRPKGAVHGHAGFPIKATQDLAHCFDLQEDDNLFWLTDIGWMMGPWAIIGALTLGATLVLYDGAPDYPTPSRLWQLVERHRATVLGVSPTLVRSLMARGDESVAGHDLSSLRAFGSTGEPWNADPWWWLFRNVGGERCPIVNYAGGTEISGGIVGGSTVAPLKPCSFTGPVPGMDADVFDDEGQPVRGRVGELVVRQPWVGMTQGFWNDPERYVETYWSRWPDVWVHGDWAIAEDDAWYILGRSDDTIKVAGKRVGPAEVESAAVAHPAVAEVVAVGAPHPTKGDALTLFVILRAGREPTEALRQEIAEQVAEQLGRPLKPDAVWFCEDLPRTRNAKIMRRVVRAAHLGHSDLGDVSALENPGSIDAVRNAR